MIEDNFFGTFLIILLICVFVFFVVVGVQEYRIEMRESEFCYNNNYSKYHRGTRFEYDDYCSRVVDGKIEKYYLGG